MKPRHLRGDAGRGGTVLSAVRRVVNTPLRRGAATALLLGLLLLVGVQAGTVLGTATAEDRPLAGRPVPASLVPVIASAALACPELSAARLSGQLMAASGFDAAASTENGGSGLAGLTDEAWEQWKPTPQARRGDPAANVTALAHQTCDAIGQVRQAGVAGDRWRLGLGALHSGVPAVRAEGGVPAAAREHVDTVAAYADWYARQEPAATGVSAAPTPAGAPDHQRLAAPKPVPDEYVPMVIAAGEICSQVPPARVAAQLMASSAFNPQLLGPRGEQGIAQFTPAVWNRYVPAAATTSPWDPRAAIPALGRVMCTLVREMPTKRDDAYRMAVAAFAVGAERVKQAGGVPDVPGLTERLSRIESYLSYYTEDGRLGGTTGPGASKPPSTKPATISPSPSSRPTLGASPGPTLGASPRPKQAWQARVIEGTQVLQRGQAWTTNRLALKFTNDGELLLSDQGRERWRAGSGGKGAERVVFQDDGNLVVYTSAWATVWSSNSAGNDGAILTLKADGNVTISIRDRLLWQTVTGD